jgi:hypothetical protein
VSLGRAEVVGGDVLRHPSQPGVLETLRELVRVDLLEADEDRG